MMEGILFGFFIGALFGAAAVVVVQGIIAAAWAKYVELNESPPSDPLPNMLRHNNLALITERDSE